MEAVWKRTVRWTYRPRGPSLPRPPATTDDAQRAWPVTDGFQGLNHRRAFLDLSRRLCGGGRSVDMIILLLVRGQSMTPFQIRLAVVRSVLKAFKWPALLISQDQNRR